MPVTEQPENTLKFKPRARIIRTIWDRLISGPIAALLELVKNAHDADAEWVRITFHPPLERGVGLIEVKDAGHGMTLEDIQSKWMEPATTDKEKRRTSPRGRRMLGAKGIGRFAAARLGESMTLCSTAKSAADQTLQTTCIQNLQWRIFDDNEYLEDVRIPYRTNAATNHATGTKIRIKQLRDYWNEKLLRKLRNDLTRLVSPLEEKDREDFRIYLDLSALTEDTCGFNGQDIVNSRFPDDEDELHRIHPVRFLSASDYEIEGDFSADGHFTGSMTIHRMPDAKPERVELDLPLREQEGEQSCGDILLHLYIFDREDPAIEEMLKRAHLQGYTKADARKLLDDMVGIAIYRDRFRIRPYGDSDNDWLELDKRRVQKPTFRIGQNQITGLVVIEGEERSSLIERSSREGLEENSSYDRLKNLITELLTQRIEPRREQYRRKAGIARRQSENFQMVLEMADFRWAELLVKELPEAKQSQAQIQISREAERLKTHLKSLQENQARLEARVTLGLIITEVLHEGRAPLAYLQRQLKRISDWLLSLCDDSAESFRRRQELPQKLNDMRDSAEKLQRLFRLLDPLSGRRRGRPGSINVVQVVKGALELYKSRIRTLGVKVKVQVDPGIPLAQGYKDDLLTALTNLIDNALYWLEYTATVKPVLVFEVSSDRMDVILEISNNGPAIPSQFDREIFDVGFSLKKDGTGLGLSISREALARSRGSLELEDTPSGVTFEVRLRKEGK